MAVDLNNRDLKIKLCEALSLDPMTVRKISIIVTPESYTVAEVEFLPTQEQVKKMVDAVKEHKSAIVVKKVPKDPKATFQLRQAPNGYERLTDRQLIYKFVELPYMRRMDIAKEFDLEEPWQFGDTETIINTEIIKRIVNMGRREDLIRSIFRHHEEMK